MMSAGHVWLATILATVLLLLCHVLIRSGNEWLYHFGASAFMPGVIVEMWLSADNLNGFGDLRSPLLINAVTWLSAWVGMLLVFGVWRMLAAR